MTTQPRAVSHCLRAVGDMLFSKPMTICLLPAQLQFSVVSVEYPKLSIVGLA